MTPQQALSLLREGNERFRAGRNAGRNLLEQVERTREGQWPFAAILSCMDSRTSAELTFDLGLGDIFSIRVAGNCVNPDVVGSLEYACKVVGSKLIVVLGHTRCGAVKGACDGVELGSLTGLLQRIAPAVGATRSACADLDTSDPAFAQQVAENNVRQAVDEIRHQSPILRDLEAAGDIAIVGAMYDVASGAAEFLPADDGATA